MATAKAPVVPTIMGHGVSKDGREVYAVQSRSQDLRWWLVSVARDSSLHCDCWAGRRNRACAHRGTVAAERRLADAQTHQSAPAAAFEAPIMASASAILARRPFSIWK